MIEFGILGPLEVVEHGRPLVLGGPKQRALLAVLLLRRGEVVSIDRLIDALWGAGVGDGGQDLHVYVSNLRRALGDGVLVTRGHGYLLQTERGQVDLDRFDELVAEGRGALWRASRGSRPGGCARRWRCGGGRAGAALDGTKSYRLTFSHDIT